MASVQKKKDRYFVVYRYQGKQVWEPYGRNYKKAKKEARKAAEALDNKKDPRKRNVELKTETDKKPTLAEVAGRWLDIKQTEVRPKTYASYKPMVRRIIAELGDKEIQAITQEDAEDFKTKVLSEAGPDLTKRVLTVFKSICDRAVQLKYREGNPLEYVSKPDTPKREMDWLSADEMKRLIAATDKRHRCLIMFACLTGCRQSEVLGLRWSDTDLVAGKVFIRQVQHGGCFYEPKTKKSRRTILIPPALTKELKLHQLRQASDDLPENKHDLVFPNRVGNPMSGLNLTRRILRPALRRAGLKEVGFHALRHSYISMLMNQGVSIKFISQQAGHSSCKITWDRYGHVYPEAEKAAIIRLEERFFGQPEEPQTVEAVAENF